MSDAPRPIDPAAVTAALADPRRWTVRHVDITGSTNADLTAAHLAGTAAPDTVLLTEQQRAGKGRLGRRWQAPYGSSLICSFLIRPAVPIAARGWVGAILGLALVEAIAGVGVGATLKWPNDVLIEGRKCAGILAEVAGDAVVVGVGLNVTVRNEEFADLPAGVLPPTSLHSAAPGAGAIDRTALAAALLTGFGARIDAWTAAAGDLRASGLLAEYRRHCGTPGSRVRMELPTGEHIVGTAVDVTDDGALRVRGDDGREQTFTAGDVRHLRPVLTR